MKKGLKIIILSVAIAFLYSGCGPDLNPTLYQVKSIINNQFEEYSFNYQGNQLSSIVGTDNTVLNYQYYRDSTSIQFNTKEYSDYFTTLFYAGDLLTKVKIRWRIANRWNKDSLTFSYIGKTVNSFKYRNGVYNITLVDGNVTTIKRGIGALATTMILDYDSKVNPLQRVNWYDPLISPSGVDPTQLRAIARYFSKNNLTYSESTVLTVKSVYKYSYTYLHDILPKAINLDADIAGNKTSNLIFIADILYTPKSASTTP